LRNAFCVDLAGLTTTADWLGSNADVFRYVESDIDLVDYFADSKRRANLSIGQAGFRRPPRPRRRAFRELFGKEPWPLHDAVTTVLASLEPGSLVVVEAAMGEGKTEAALLIYDALASSGNVGLFFALPTQATANQILGRVERYIATSFAGLHGLHLVHGGAGLSEKYEALKSRARLASVDGVSGADDAPVADAWFCRAKRALLAPFGVGTVDQALFGVLRTRHHFLRLHGLAGKIFVVDEVHAYDTFTSSILARLCEWLEALGTTVVLLSATLSSPQRANLLAAYGATQGAPLAPYPRVTVARKGEALQIVPFPSRRKPVTVTLEWHDGASLPALVAKKLRSGGCIVWIVNTVAKAQSLYISMKELLAEASVELELLHARFPMADRLTREARAEAAFGPPGPGVERPHAALLIGTQVLEQSLDFDFDLMVTEVAPIDLIFQRAGRLHRHERGTRPPGLEARTLWLELPSDGPLGPEFGPTTFVYDEAVVLASYLVLKSRSSLEIPNDIEPLVEAVYVERPDHVGELPVHGAIVGRLHEARAQREHEAAGESYKAELKILPAPAHDSPFGAFSCSYDEEDPAVHESLKAVTRLGDPSVTVVPVQRRGEKYVLVGNRDVAFDPDAADLPFGVARKLARGAIALSQRSLVSRLLHDAALYPRVFRRSGMLGHHRLLVLDERRHAVVGSTHITLDSELGLLIGELAADRAESSPAHGPEEEEP
jgi:CRISPR-associated endonuclease/helicase Cas3